MSITHLSEADYEQDGIAHFGKYLVFNFGDVWKGLGLPARFVCARRDSRISFTKVIDAGYFDSRPTMPIVASGELPSTMLYAAASALVEPNSRRAPVDWGVNGVKEGTVA